MSLFNGNLVYRNQDGDIQEWNVSASYVSKIQVGPKSYEAYKYTLSENTFAGLCMAPLISDTKPSVIAGFHLGGQKNGPLGVAGILTKAALNKCVEQLDLKPQVLVAHSEGTLKREQYEVKVVTSEMLHRNSCINFLPLDNSLKVYGSTIGRSTYRSDVIRTPISKTVEKVCGIPCEHGPPRFHPWKPFYEGIKKTSYPSVGVSPKDLDWAVQDYIEPLTKLIQTKHWKSEVKPLTKMQTLCGIDGKRFVDKMPPNTSVGFPLSGSKRNFMTALDPDHYPDFNCPMEIDEKFWEEAAELEATYLRGERGYPIFKASLKDEPTKLTKEKVRVFFAAPIHLQFLVRKYFLPLCRFLSMNPIVSECAVGINAQGPEWDQLAKTMCKFGKSRIFAGDYSKYDTRMAAQLSLASWGIFITLAELTGNYTQDELTIMRGVATDCCYPVVAYNGDLIEFAGVHISGINLTAYVGSIDNSLLQRSGYHHLASLQGGEIAPYRSRVSVSNYGDDFKGSVSKETPWFNHISYKQYLAEHDIVLTMPDKESEPTEYMNDHEADFLKRHNIYNPDTGLYFGALDKASIFKSLHTVLKSGAVTPLQQSAMNIDGALREMFAHGRDQYEGFRVQMKEVAAEHDLSSLCLMLNQTYDDRMQNFREKYLGEEPVQQVEEHLPDLEFQGGKEKSDYTLVKEMVHLTPILEDKYLGTSELGEIDLLFCCLHEQKSHFLLFEVKKPSVPKKKRSQGRAQVRKYIRALRALRPDACIHGFLVHRHEIGHVQTVGFVPPAFSKRWPVLFPLETIFEE